MSGTYLDRVSNKALGQMLVEKGALSDQQVNEALELSRREHIRLGQALVALGFIGDDALSYTIAEQYGQRPMELHPSMVDAELVSRFDFGLLSRHGLLPLIELEDELVVAVSDPNDTAGLDKMAQAVPGRKILPQLAAPAQIERCLEALRIQRNLAREEHAGETSMARMDLPPPDPAAEVDSPQFPAWLFAVAAQSWGRDVILRQHHDLLQAVLTPAAPANNLSTADAGVRVVAGWPERRLADVLPGVLSPCASIEFTGGRAFQLSRPARLDGHDYDILVTLAGDGGASLTGPLQMGVRAMRRVKWQVSPARASSVAAVLSAGQCIYMEYGADERLDELLADFAQTHAAAHQVVLNCAALRSVIAGAATYPAPFTDITAAARAHRATVVVFDELPPSSVICRLMSGAGAKPAVVIFIPPGLEVAHLPWPGEIRRSTPPMPAETSANFPPSSTAYPAAHPASAPPPNANNETTANPEGAR